MWNAAANSTTDTVAQVVFGAATKGVSFGYNPAAGTFGGLSVAGQNGDFTAAMNGDVGSPGSLINLPSFRGFSYHGSNGFNLGFVTQSNLDYSVEYKNRLTDSSWLVLTNFTATSNSFSLTDPSANTNSTRFYRVVVTP